MLTRRHRLIRSRSLTKPGDYLATIEHALSALDDKVFDVCLYNAGMDPHEDSAIGGLDGITAEKLRERERWFFQWAARRELPVAFVLAGGYASGALTEDALVGLHRLTIEAGVNGGRFKSRDKESAVRGLRGSEARGRRVNQTRRPTSAALIAT